MKIKCVVQDDDSIIFYKNDEVFIYMTRKTKWGGRVYGEIYNADENKAYLSGLVHDCAKNLEEYYMLNNKVNSDIIFDTEEKKNIINSPETL